MSEGIPTGEMVKRPLTKAELQRRWRAKSGSRTMTITCDIQSAAALLYIRKQWGIKSNAMACKIALRYLAIQTRMNPDMKELKLDID